MVELTAAAVFGVYAIASALVLQLVNTEVRTPYMDEQFHIRQAQWYCMGAFNKWDPKLTTPPGLYIVSLAVRTMGACTLDRLRAVNCVLGCILFWTVYALIRQNTRPFRAAIKALTLCMLPTSFFFAHVYYTDIASLLCVLLAQLLSVHKRHVWAGVVGGAAVWMRQTNVVWVALVGGAAVERWMRENGVVSGGLVQSVGQLVQWMKSPRRWREAVWVAVPYAFVVMAFGVFVRVNGGIVLGDKSNHQAGVHVPQMFYFCAFTAAMAAPTVLTEAQRYTHAVTSRQVTCFEMANYALETVYANLYLYLTYRPVLSTAVGLALTLVMAVGVNRFTVEHPFLLGDNRHYTFYIWKNLFRSCWWARYLYIPGYVSCMLGVHAALWRAPALWHIMWLVCTAAVLVPSPLLELRYFTVPFFLARLHMPTSLPRLSIELAMYIVVNAVTIYVFLYHPFVWSSEPNQLQRFMW
ncbi:glucosyltransferase [Coemansia sp. RSA 2522]|nr:glucosyltransferase [Coemansia sp. RSA 560]KAJ2427733.1 glucosyltransferase [Coemansia sp. RSA 2524]KAJ2430738.1 glucosyltransferase [Coemansia sp. RSA 2522]